MDLQGPYLDERIQVSPGLDYPPLPFFHTTEAYFLQGILDKRALSPKLCKRFDEMLLYLFYGKPGYKSGEINNSKLVAMMPVCFIINYDAVTNIKRAVAFDSGAFDKYSDFMHSSMGINEFFLTPTKEAIRKVVRYFYQGNLFYFKGDARHDINYDPGHFQIQSYHNLIDSGHKMTVDDRKACVEAQLDYEIPLDADHIAGIILPENLVHSESIGKVLRYELNIPLIPVENFGIAAKDYYVSMLKETQKFMVQQKLMDER